MELHVFNALRAARSCCLATGGAARCSAAGENASQPATGQLSSAALNQPVRKATVYWMCLNALQLRGRLDQIYTIDLVEACLSVCELPHLRLAQLVESPAAGDDPRRVRERTINSKLLLCSFHDTDNISSVCRTRPISRAASVLGGSRMRHRARGLLSFIHATSGMADSDSFLGAALIPLR